MRKKNPSQHARTEPPAPRPGSRGREERPSGRPWERFRSLLSAPVDGASLAAVRVAIGLAMVLESYSLCRPSDMIQGDIPLHRYFTGPDIHFHFPYEIVAWLPLLPAAWMQAVVGILALAGLSMALGFCYRVSAATVFLTWGYLFAVESTRTYWQSYYYIELLFTFLMIWMPAARRYSIDAWLAREEQPTVPFWTVFLLRGQLVIAYFYAGVSKVNLDWLLDAVPLRWDLAEAHLSRDLQPHLSAPHLELIKNILHSEWLAYALSYLGVAFDLSIGFLLLGRRTRIFGMILMVLFHATNHFVIYANIDWFPLVGVTTALIFLEPDWPERFWNWLRHPRLPRPDWAWFAGGAIVFPIVGAALGWKSHASPPSAPAPRAALGRGTVAFVAGWLIWQMVMPLRHYLIPGDARFTYEGLSFSWRLKADDHRALTAQLYVDDPAIISRDGAGRTRLDWNQWHGDKVIYRRLTPGKIQWEQLPEIMVLLEPLIGQRIIYNPWAGASVARTDFESRDRVRNLWRQVYGREPPPVRPTAPLAQVLESISAELSAAGMTDESGRLAALMALTAQVKQAARSDGSPPPAKVYFALRTLLGEWRGGKEWPGLARALQALEPFALEGEGRGGFLSIEDPALLVDRGDGAARLNAAQWKTGPHPGGPRSPMDLYLGAEPLIVYMGDIGPESRSVLPQACVLDSQEFPGRPPYIWWNSLKDLSPSKLMHVSFQPFYLRRYARRVADLWEQDYARRPAVRANTAMSLNGRPYQQLVDPTADLARAKVTWLGHNEWIKDLEMRRIPHEALRWDRSSP